MAQGLDIKYKNRNIRVVPLESDLKNLSEIIVGFEYQGQENIDFSPYVVKKPWGYEYLFYECENSAIWALCLKKDAGTSFHCHPNKKTALLVLQGKVNCSTFTGDHILNRGDVIHLEAKVFHRTSALENDTWILEIESPVDKADLIRLSDNYGRRDQGYESLKDYDKISQRDDLIQITPSHPENHFQNADFLLTENISEINELKENELLAILSTSSKLFESDSHYIRHPSAEVFTQSTFKKHREAFSRLKNLTLLKITFNYD
jgi:quercetin dioxygenase-like cupin family protein